MKHPTSTPVFVSTGGVESQNFSTLDWSSKFDFHLQQKKSRKTEVLHPSLLSPESLETRRVSTSSNSSNSRSGGSSCSSLSESSLSLGFRSYDEIDDATASGSTIDDDDPIISLEALSLDTQRNKFGATVPQTPIEKPKPVTAAEEKKKHLKFGIQGIANGMGRSKEHKQELSNESLKSASLFEKNGLDPTIRLDSNSPPRVKDRIRGQKQAWEFQKTNFSILLSNESSTPDVSMPKTENKYYQQRRTIGKKYIVKMRTNTTSITETKSQRTLRSKRQRGGSDFSMASCHGIDDLTNNSRVTAASSPSSRKRRRINRNRAMAADDFDSILSQIHTGTI